MVNLGRKKERKKKEKRKKKRRKTGEKNGKITWESGEEGAKQLEKQN